MKIVYVAGPFRSSNQWGQAQNIRRAEEIALAVWYAGAAAICPHANTAHFQGALEDHVWLRGDLEIMRRCDAVMLTPNWRRSTGATEERRVAKHLGIPVFDNIKELEGWLAKKKHDLGRSSRARQRR